jgi:hypothetical protein
MTSAKLQDRPGRRGGRLEDRAVTRCQRGRELPRGHQQREVEGDDLPDHAERLAEVVGDQILADFGRPALLRARSRGEVAEVVDHQRDVGGQGLADRLAVLPAFGDR